MVVTTIVLISVALLIALSVFFYYVPFFLWISARVSGVHISLMQLFLMRIRKVPASVIVRALIEAHKAGLNDVNRDDLEAH
ncbi:flotillin-like FloA family protein, partial [uncultured Duncaniella sp.]